MSAPPRMSKSSADTPVPSAPYPQQDEPVPDYKDCLSCRIIGTGALAMTGIYALRMARPGAPGTRFGKAMMAGAGVGFLAGSVVRWNRTPMEMIEMFVDQFRGTPSKTGS